MDNNNFSAVSEEANSVERLAQGRFSYVRPREFIMYGVANGGQCMSWNMFSGYITYFFVNLFNVDARIVSAMLFIEGIWDTINDPLMGSLIDKTRTRYGKLKPYLLGIPIPLAISTMFVFAGPLIFGDLASNSIIKVMYMIITYFVWETLYTVGDVAFWGLSAAVSPQPNDRTKTITSARIISGIVSAPSTLLLPIFIDLVNNHVISTSLRTVFFVFAVASSIVGMAIFSTSGFLIKERVVQSDDEPSFGECLKVLYTNKPLRLMILKDVLSSLGGIGGVFSTYYMVDVLGSVSISLIIGIPGTILGFASYLFLPAFKRRFNNKQLLIISKVLSAILSVFKYLLCIGGGRYKRIVSMSVVMALESTINSLMSSVNSVVTPEMIGETVDYSEWTTGQRTEGVSFSVLTFVGKFTNAVGRSAGAFLIPYIGYKTSSTGERVIQTEKTKGLIFSMSTIIPSLLGLFGLIPLFRYDLVGEKRSRMFTELEHARAKRARELSEIENGG